MLPVSGFATITGGGAGLGIEGGGGAAAQPNANEGGGGNGVQFQHQPHPPHQPQQPQSQHVPPSTTLNRTTSLGNEQKRSIDVLYISAQPLKVDSNESELRENTTSQFLNVDKEKTEIFTQIENLKKVKATQAAQSDREGMFSISIPYNCTSRTHIYIYIYTHIISVYVSFFVCIVCLVAFLR